MDYASFKNYLITFLWKAGDAVLIANLDNLIRMSNHELDRVLRVERRHSGAVLSVDTVSTLNVALPTDYHSIRSLECVTPAVNQTKFTYVEPARLFHMRKVGQNRYWAPYYSIRGRELLLTGPLDVTPVDFELDYNAKVPDFQATNTSWVEEEYLDLYTYCVLKQAAMFLREDERVPLWQQSFADAINTAIDDSEHSQVRGPSAAMPLPRQASVNRRR